MEDKPKVSVIVPVYKAEKYIRQCVDSLLAQSFEDYEILLINDGSPDKSGEICDEYALKDSRIRVFHKSNSGVSATRNIGMDNARGEWIAFVDSDDWVESDFLSPLAQDYPQLDIIHMGYIKEDPTGNTMIFTPKQEGVIASQDFFSAGVFMSVSCIFFFRKRMLALNAISFPENVSYSEDRAFIAKCVLKTQYVLQLKRRLIFIELIQILQLIRRGTINLVWMICG